MRVAIIGDSFTARYRNTWNEKLVSALNLELISSVGYPGQSNYKIFKNFLDIIDKKPDLIIIVYTDYGRLYHPSEAIGAGTVNQDALLIKQADVLNAARNYYNFLYQDDYAQFNDKLLINEIQNICKEKNIKLINIPAFFHYHINKFYGLWVLTDGGIVNCSKADYEKNVGKWEDMSFDTRLNHFTKVGHEIMCNNLKLHISYYINNNLDYNIVHLSPEIFA